MVRRSHRSLEALTAQERHQHHERMQVAEQHYEQRKAEALLRRGWM